MIRFDLFNITEITFNSTHTALESNIREIHYDGFYVVSMKPDLDHRIQVFCKKLLTGMPEQTYESLDIPGLFEKWQKAKEDAKSQKYVW